MNDNDYITKINEILVNELLTVSDIDKKKNTIFPLISLTKEKDSAENVPYLTKYKIEEVIIQCFLALLATAKTISDMGDFGVYGKRFFYKYFDITNIATQDTISKIFSIIDPSVFEESASIYIKHMFETIGKKFGLTVNMEHISIDGKEEKGNNTEDKLRNIQLENVYDEETPINYYSIPIPNKNEILLIQDCLRQLNLKNKLVTGRASQLQQETLQIIQEKLGSSLFELDESYPTLLEEIKNAFAHFKEKKDNLVTFKNTSPDQIDSGSFKTILIKDTSVLKQFPGIVTIVEFATVTSSTQNNKESIKSEIKYYLTSLTKIELIKEGIRSYQNINNASILHLYEDFDGCSFMVIDKNCQTNRSILSNLALSFLKVAKPILKGESVHRTANKFRWGLEETLKKLSKAFAKQSKPKIQPKKTTSPSDN
jgi:predicted transposase YbfD/YdcC